MSDFSSVRAQLTRLYSEKAYAQAFDLLQREADNFPQQGMMYHWKMCLTALLNRPEQAIQALREALEKGYFYASALLCDDEDLQTLQGLSEYKELVARSVERFADLEAHSRAELLVVPPESQSTEPLPLLIGLHGNSQNAQLAAQDWQPLSRQGWLLALPQSSQLITTNAYIWNDMVKGSQEVQEMHASLTRDYRIDPERVVLGGFSMGGGLAISMAVTGAIPVRGFIAVGPSLRDYEKLAPYLEAARARGVRGYILMGLYEPLESQDLMRRTADFLTNNGVPCEIEERPTLAHAFPPDFAVTLQKALAFLFQQVSV
ncbi:MAG TPA: PHB depolymerase family esterase [Ktedonobacteraceae bacterium]|nr:PHB depolymerase family esterase [Ktedonobacteraceae bacterium]